MEQHSIHCATSPRRCRWVRRTWAAASSGPVGRWAASAAISPITRRWRAANVDTAPSGQDSAPGTRRRSMVSRSASESDGVEIVSSTASTAGGAAWPASTIANCTGKGATERGQGRCVRRSPVQASAQRSRNACRCARTNRRGQLSSSIASASTTRSRRPRREAIEAARVRRPLPGVPRTTMRARPRRGEDLFDACRRSHRPASAAAVGRGPRADGPRRPVPRRDGDHPASRRGSEDRRGGPAARRGRPSPRLRAASGAMPNPASSTADGQWSKSWAASSSVT